MIASTNELDLLPKQLLSRGSRFKPSVWRVESPVEPIIVKDVRDVPSWSRPLARLLLRREIRLLRRLEGIPNVPVVLGRIAPGVWATRTVVGVPLNKQAFRGSPRRIADELLALTRALHARGVYHLDLRQPQNVLIDEVGHVGIVDFGAGIALGRLLRPLVGRLFAWIDEQATLKYLARYAPEAMRIEEARSFLRGQRLRRLWFLSPHRPAEEIEGARARVARG